MLRPQDTLVLLKIQAIRDPAKFERDRSYDPSPYLRYADLGASLSISASQSFESVKRLQQSGLLYSFPKIVASAALEWLVHGVKYFQPPQFGGITRGILTSYAARPLNAELIGAESSTEPPPVWDFTEGERGISLEPIYPTVPIAASKDNELYELLTLLDAIRSGRAREKKLANDLLKLRFTAK